MGTKAFLSTVSNTTLRPPPHPIPGTSLFTQY